MPVILDKGLENFELKVILGLNVGLTIRRYFAGKKIREAVAGTGRIAVRIKAGCEGRCPIWTETEISLRVTD